MLGNEPLGQMIIEMDLNSVGFTKGLTAVNRSIKSAEREMKANMTVLNNADDKYGALGKQVEGLNKVMSLNEKRIEQLNEKRKREIALNGEASEEVQKLNREINTAVQRQSAWEKQLKIAKAEMVNFKASTKDLEEEFSKLKKSTDDNVASLKKSGLAFSAQKEKLKGLSEQSNKHRQIVELQKQKVDDLTKEFGEHDRRVVEATSKYKSLVEEQKKLDNSFNSLNRKVSTVGPRMGKFADNLGKAEAKLKGLSDRSIETGNKVKDAGRDITSTFGGIATAGGLGLGYTIKQAADFEQAMADIKALMAPSEWAQYGKPMTKLVKDLGVETKYSNKEVAIGLQELIKAGVDLEAIMGGGLRSALSLATAGELELGDAAEISSTVLNSFRDDGISMAKAADLLAGSANASATSVGEMKYSLAMVSSVASSVGFSFADTNNALAVFAQNGLKGSDAGTSLKTMIMRLSPQTQAAATIMEDLGISTTNTTAGYKFLVEKGLKPASRTIPDLEKAFKELAKQELGSGASKADLAKETDRLRESSGYLSSAFFDEQGNVRSMSEVFGILEKSTKNLSKEQKINAFNTMFGSDAIRAAMIASKAGRKAFDEMGVSINKVKADDVAETKMKTLKGAIEKMTGEAESAATAFGFALVPTLKSVAGTVEKTVGWFNKLDESTQHSIAKWTAIGVGITAVGAGLGLVTMSIGGFIYSYGMLKKGVGGILGFLKKGVLNLSSFDGKTKASTQSLNNETIALNTNTTALERNNAARRGEIVGSGRSNKKGTKGKTNIPVNTYNEPTTRVGKTKKTQSGLGKVGKGGLLKKRLPIGKVAKAGGIFGLALGGLGIYDAVKSKDSDKWSGVGSAAGSMTGGAIGAALGSFIPGFGTALGGIAGSYAGDKLGTIIGQEFDKNAKKTKAKKAAEKGATLSLKVKGIDDSTQAALKEYDKLYQGAKVKLNQIMMSNTVINGAIKKDTIQKFTEMKDNVLATLKERQQKERVEAQKALASNKSLSDKEKQQALAKLDEKHKAEVDKINKGNARINEIMSNASKEKRALSSKEKAEINRINNQMYDVKIKKTAKSESEITRIKRERSKQRNDITTKEMHVTIATAEKEFKKTVAKAKDKYNKKVEYAKIQRDQLGVITDKEYKKIVDNARKEKEKTIDQAKEKKNDVVRHAKAQKRESTKASREQKEANVKNAQKETSGIGKAWAQLAKPFKSLMDWFSGLFGGKKAPEPPIYNSKSKGPTPMYAKGTYQGKHKGGTALVGEEGAELSYIPNRGYSLLGVGGPQVLDLPSGSAVLPHDKTKDILSRYNFPAFKNGTGDDDWFKKTLKGAGNFVKNGVGYLKNKAVDAFNIISNPDAMYGKLKDAFGFNIEFPKIMDSWTSGTMAGWVKDKAVKMIKGLFGKMSDGSDITLGNTAVTNKWGVYDSLYQIAQKVMSSPLGRGLVVTSGHRPGDTYDHGRHAAIDLSGFGSNGGYKAVAKWASMLPGVAYTIGDNTVYGRKYGNGLKPSWATGHMNHVHISTWPGAKYENGGIINKQHLAMLGEGDKQEVVIPLQPKPGMRSRALDLLAYAAQNLLGKNSSSASSLDTQAIQAIIQRQDAQMSMMQQQIDLLTQLLAKSTDVFLDGRPITKVVESYINKREQRKNRAMGRPTI